MWSLIHKNCFKIKHHFVINFRLKNKTKFNQREITLPVKKQKKYSSGNSGHKKARDWTLSEFHYYPIDKKNLVCYYIKTNFSSSSKQKRRLPEHFSCSNSFLTFCFDLIPNLYNVFFLFLQKFFYGISIDGRLSMNVWVPCSIIVPTNPVKRHVMSRNSR